MTPPMCSVNCPYRLGEICPLDSSRKTSIRESADVAQARLFGSASTPAASAEVLRNCLRSICGSFRNWNCLATQVALMLHRFEPMDCLSLNPIIRCGVEFMGYCGVTSTLHESLD